MATAEEKALEALAEAEAKHLAKLKRLGTEHDAAVAAKKPKKAEAKQKAIDKEVAAYAKKRAKLAQKLADAQALPAPETASTTKPRSLPADGGDTKFTRRGGDDGLMGIVKRWWWLVLAAIPLIAVLAWLQNILGCQ